MKLSPEIFPYKWLALIGLCLLSFTVFLDFTIVSTALPFIQKDLNANLLQLQWVTNIFSMVLCIFMIAAGKAGDLLGRKKVFYAAFAIFLIAAIGAALSPSIQCLIFFRAIQGLASSVIATVGASLIPQAFPPEEQNRAIGVYSAFNGVGLASGPFLGGFLISLFSWRWIFWVNVPIIIVGMLLCVFTLKPAPQSDHQAKIDWLGLVLLAVGLGGIIYGVIHGEQFGWGNLLTWFSIIVGIIAILLLLIVENKVMYPLLDLTLFKNKRVVLAMLICISAAFPAYVFMFFDPLYLQFMRKQTAWMLGLSLLCVPLVQVVLSLFFQKLINRFGLYQLLVYGLGVAVITGVLHAFFTPTIGIYFVLLAFILMGYTWALGNTGTLAAVTTSVPAEKTGGTIGTVFTFWNLSGSIVLALSTVIFHNRENAAFSVGLNKSNLPLTATQHHQISLLLSDPKQVQLVLNQFGEKANEIFQIFHDSFMSGFHWVAWFSSMFMFVVLLVGLQFRKG